MIKIPVYQPSLSGREKEYVLDCLDSTWISSKGEYITRFEQKFAQVIGVSHAVTVCNGTVALHLAMLAAEALGIEAKDVFPSVGDTTSVGYSFQTVASRTTFATGIAVYEAAQKILAQMAERAALIWQVGVDEVAVDKTLLLKPIKSH